MTDSRGDIKRHQDAVRKYLATPAKDLGITEDMLEAYAMRSEYSKPKDLLFDSRMSAMSNSVEVPVTDLRAFLGSIAQIPLGDLVLMPEDRKKLRESMGAEYSEELEMQNYINNQTESSHPQNSLLKHIAFIDALEDMLANGARVDPKVVRDELAILQAILHKHNSNSAHILQYADGATPEEHFDRVARDATTIITDCMVTGRIVLPLHAEELRPEMQQMMNMGDGQEKKDSLGRLVYKLMGSIASNQAKDYVDISESQKQHLSQAAEEDTKSADVLMKTYIATLELAKALEMNVERPGKGKP